MGVPSDDNYSSIDPVALAGATTALENTSKAITAHIAGLKSGFEKESVTTLSIVKLTGLADKIDGLTPALRRRQSMAEQLLLVHPSKSGVVSFQGDILGAFPTTAAAAAQAKSDAEAFKKDPKDASALANLSKYGTDADYANALREALGTTAIGTLLQSQDEDSDTIPVLGTWLATTSYKNPITEDFLIKLGDGTEQEADNQAISMQVFSRYLVHGTWSQTSLDNVAKIVFENKMDNPSSFPWNDDSSYQTRTNLLNAFANNAPAAANYFNANHDLMYKMFTSEQLQATDYAEKAMNGFMRAATIDARNEMALDHLDQPGANPAIRNAQWLMQKAAGDGDAAKYSTSGQRVLFANLSAEYVDDFAYSVGSPIDPGSVDNLGRDGVNLSQDQWKAFLKLGMSDNTGLVIIGSAFQQKIDALKNGYVDDTKSDRGGNDADTAADAHGWDAYTIGAMQSVFQHTYSEVGADRKKSESEQEEALNKIIDTGIDWATDPKGIVKSAGKLFAGSLLHLAVKSAIGSEPMPPMPTGFDSQRNYADFAVRALSTGGQDFKPYKDGSGLTWDGNPKLYTEPSPPCGDFTKYVGSDGDMDYDAIKKDPAAWASFNSWLQDPAVSASTFPQYTDSTVGALRGGAGG